MGRIGKDGFEMGQIDRPVLIISEGPPPLGDTVAEGGALRAWGLAKGLSGHGHKVTFAYRKTYKIGSDSHRTTVPKGVTIETWDPQSIDDLLKKHTVVIMRYAMGESALIITRLSDRHILISDSYVPISIEVSARNSDDEDEQINYLRLQHSSKLASRRADYILYASPQQKDYYIGYLSGINKLNPKTYAGLEKRMFEVPYGVDPKEKPVVKISPPKEPTLLWYGAFYSWFDAAILVDALLDIKKSVPNFKFLVAGARNPYNQDPGLINHYNQTVAKLDVLGNTIEYIPWGPFDERFSTYARASAIISYNHEGVENNFAWRTRLMDYLLADRPILTNGGDPLGEDLIKRKVAFRIEPATLQNVFTEAISNPPTDKDFADAVERYSWDEITRELSESIKHATRMIEADMEIRLTVFQSVKKAARFGLLLPVKLVRYIRKHGVKKTVSRVTQGK